MARQTDSEYTGTIGNIIFYERYGKFLMRTVQKQAISSQDSAKAFGKASSKAKILRRLLTPFIRDPRNKEMQNRLCADMRKFLASLANTGFIQPQDNPLAGFRFIPGSDLKLCLKFPLGIIQQPDGKVSVEIPAITPTKSIVAPAGTSRVELQLMAVSFLMDNNQSFAGNPEGLNIPYTDEPQPALNVVLETQAEPGSIVVVAAALSYWNENRRICREGFMPAEIVAVF